MHNSHVQAGPKADTKSTFESSDGHHLNPSAPIEDLRDERMMDAAVGGHRAQAPVANGDPDLQGDASEDLGIWVRARGDGPVGTEGARGFAPGAGHESSLDGVAIPVATSDCRELEVRSTLPNGDNYSQQDEEWALVVKKIDSFTPKVDPADWEVIETFVRAAVRDAEPDRYTTAQPWLSAVAQLVQWSIQVECLDLEREVIFHPANIFDFVGQRDTRSDGAQGTIRSILLRISARLLGEHPGATEDRRSYNASQGKKPYTASEKHGLRSFVNGQATEHRRKNLEIVVALAAGAGVTAVELLLLTSDHIEVRRDMVLIHVPGKNSRTVPVLAEWEDLVRHIARVAPMTGPLVLRNYVKYRVGNAVADFLWTCNGEGVKPHCQRLRSTWMVDHLKVTSR